MSLENSLEKKQPVLAKNEINEKDRECILVACWYVAFADGRLYREANLMRSIAQRLQINQKTSNKIKKQVARGELLPEFPSGLAGKKLMFKLVLDVATSDGHLKLAEIESIRRIGELAGWEKGEIDRELEALGADAKGENNLVNKGENSQLDSDADCSHDDSGLEQSLQRLVASEASGAVAAKSPLTSLVLILWGNVAPALGVLFLDWRVFPILLVFWLENIIIGMVNAAKMSWASGNQSYGKNAMPVWFFCLHFGGFCLVHGIFVFVVFFDSQWFNVELPGSFFWQLGTLLFCVFMIAVEHAYELYCYVKSRQYERVSYNRLLLTPYGRVVAVHLTILLGAFLVSVYQEMVLALLVLLVIKACFDLIGWANDLPQFGKYGKVKRIFAEAGIAGLASGLFGGFLLGWPASFIAHYFSGGLFGERLFFVIGISIMISVAIGVALHRILEAFKIYRQKTNYEKSAVMAIPVIAILLASLVFSDRMILSLEQARKSAIKKRREEIKAEREKINNKQMNKTKEEK